MAEEENKGTEHVIRVNIANDDNSSRINEDKKWEVEHAVHCLLEAEKIKADSELMKLVAPELEKQAKAALSAADVLYGQKRVES